MRKFYKSLFLVALLAISQISFGQFYDGFTGTGNIGGNCTTIGATPDCESNGWYTHSGTNGTIDIIAGSLSYNGLQASTGNKIYIIGNNTQLSRDVNHPVTISGNVAYYSAIINVLDSTNLHETNVNYFMHFATTSGNSNVTVFPARLGIKKGSTPGTFNLAVSNLNVAVNAYTVSTVDLPFNTPVFAVVKYDISANTAYLWVNPTDLGQNEPTGFVSNNASTSTASAIAAICIRNGWDNTNTCGTPKAEIDEIRVGTTWASVTPTPQSVNENSFMQASLYPNPAKDFIMISANENIANVKIYDMQGKVVKQLALSAEQEIKIDVKDLTNGIYSVVALSNNGKVFNSKFVK
ncbi:MAG: T9SS type A sorting domain-containing protein [Bacteroidales bacterium]|nr:T9SS type A sorting domain-containing protein [Bacteroidales bacterium]